MCLHAPYDGNDGVLVGDGNKLHISHTGSLLYSDLTSLQFSDTLLVHSMSKNLLSVSKLCQQNNFVVIFSASDFQVKDCILLRGPRINGLYVWPANVRTSTSPSTLLRLDALPLFGMLALVTLLQKILALLYPIIIYSRINLVISVVIRVSA